VLQVVQNQCLVTCVQRSIVEHAPFLNKFCVCQYVIGSICYVDSRNTTVHPVLNYVTCKCMLQNKKMLTMTSKVLGGSLPLTPTTHSCVQLFN
jgi:hypothetical protein